VRQLQFFGADPNITELRGLVALREWRAEAYRALVSHALQNADGWDCMLLSGVPIDLDLAELATATDFEWVGQTADYTLTLQPSWAAFRTALPRNIKESLRKCYNSLKRDGLEFRLQVAESLASVEPALARFFELHAARAALGGTVAHHDAFASSEARHFLKDVCRRFAARGALRIFQLLIGNKVVAVRIGFVAGDTLYLYYSGYDLEFAKYSVMTTTVAEAIRYAIGQGFSRVNLSTGNDVSKARWDPTERVTRQALLVSRSTRAKLTQSMYRHALHAIDAMPALRRATTFLARRSTPPPAALR
jgi:CelD/BcsL family acetyltransferase involved in cellulose biosynthesis